MRLLRRYLIIILGLGLLTGCPKKIDAPNPIYLNNTIYTGSSHLSILSTSLNSDSTHGTSQSDQTITFTFWIRSAANVILLNREVVAGKGMGTNDFAITSFTADNYNSQTPVENYYNNNFTFSTDYTIPSYDTINPHDSIRLKFTIRDQKNNSAFVFYTIYLKPNTISSSNHQVTTIPFINLERINGVNEVSNNTGIAVSGSTIEFNLQVSAFNGLYQVKGNYKGINGSGSLDGLPVNTFSSTTDQINCSFTLPEFKTDSVFFTFYVTDKKGFTDSVYYEVTVKEPNLLTTTGIVLGAQNSSYGSYYISSEAMVLKPANLYGSDYESYIDVTYAVVSSTGFLLSYKERNDPANGLIESVPYNASMSYFTATTLTESQFDTVGVNYLSQVNINASSPQEIAINQGGVYAFLNSNGKKGLLKITTLSSGLTGYIIFDSKVQK